MRTVSQLLFALLAIGLVKAYIDGGWSGVNHFVKLKVVGQ